MRKVALSIFILTLITVYPVQINAAPMLSKSNEYLVTQNQESEEEVEKDIYKEIFIYSIMNAIDKAIKPYYPNKEARVDQTSITILDVKRPFGDNFTIYDIYVKVTPFTGAHNTIGEDLVTIRIMNPEKIFKVIKYKHINNW